MMNERELGMIITKLEAIREDIQELKKFNEELARRTSSLESFRAWASGVGAVCVGVIGLISKNFLDI